jgi:hypothetical protein
MSGCVQRKTDEPKDPSFTGDVVDNNPVYDGGKAKWDENFCRAKWQKPGTGKVFDEFVYFIEADISNFKKLPPFQNWVKDEATDFDKLRVAVKERKVSGVEARINEHNLPLSESAPLIANRLKVPGIKFSSSRPASRWLFEAVQRDSFIIVLELKKHFNRARPYQRLGVKNEADAMFYPGHPSYPSGHAMDGAIVLGICQKLWSNSDGKIDPLYVKSFKKVEDEAKSYGYLREVAGVHFSSDTEAGKALAKLILDNLIGSADFENDLRLAKKEWGTT